MNINQEQLNDNHLKLVVNINPEDYLTKVDEEIRSLSKKITMNGFRPGKVPAGLARKFYGNSVLADQLDKMLNDSVLNYIKEHDLKVLGQPIPFQVKEQQIDVKQPASYDFGFEVGLIPEFDLPSLDQKVFEKKVINVTDEMINTEVERIRSTYGERSYPETIGEEDILSGEWKELDENGELRENGITSSSSFTIKVIKDEVIKQVLLSLKKNETTDVNIKTAFGNDMELIIHHILKTDHESAERMHDRFRFTLLNITHIEKAALNQELFNKAFGEGKINSEEELRTRIKNDLATEYGKYSDSDLDREIQNYFVNETKMNLPADFIRKLINANKEKDQNEIDDAQLAQYINQTKWDLIHDRIARDNNIVASKEEVIDRAKTDVANYYGGGAVFEGNPETLDRLVQSLIADEKYANRIMSQILNDKIFEMLRSRISAEEKAVSPEEFFHH